MEKLRAAVDEFVRESGDVEPRELRTLIDRLEGKFAQVVRQASQRGDHLASGHCSAVSWVMDTCTMSQGSAANRLLVGKRLEGLPAVSQALSSGQIGYQSASVICRLSEKLGEKGVTLDEVEWIGYARQFSIKDMNDLAVHTRYVVDPDGFDRETEENYEERFLYIQEMKGMFHLEGVMDPEGGAALKTAIDALAKRLDADDRRTPKQLRADALTELTYHALDAGTLPRRSRVRPHITVTTTLAGLKGELGAAASELQPGMLVSSKTVQRLACDGTLCRVLKADSQVIDVGRATRAVSGAQWRGLKARHRGCAFPGCDRPINWTQPHHIDFWAHGGNTNMRKLLPLCYHHHRLVHEGGWQVLQTDEGLKFIPPDRVVRRRWGERWAA